MSAIQPTKLIGDGSKHHHHIRHGHTTSRTKAHSGCSRTAGRQAGFTPGDRVRRSAGRTASFLRFYHRIVPSCQGETMVLTLENLKSRDQTMPDSNEIRARVTKVLVQALGVEEDDVKPSATLQGDLGAESIDFLDIVFRLEREFVIKIRKDELFPVPLFQGDGDIVQDGRVTDEGLAVLRLHMPYADLSDLERDRRLSRINDLFTVELLLSYITWRLGGSGGADGDAAAKVDLESGVRNPGSGIPLH
jgi:acyl carrier protein